MTLRRSVLLLVCAAGAFAQRKDPAIYVGPESREIKLPAPSRAHALPRAAMVRLGALSVEERAKLGPVGPKRRIGVHRAIAESTLARGTWTALPDGRSVWRLAIHSQSASGVRVEFSNFSIGSGKLWLHTAASDDGPYTDRGPYGNGEFWSATVDGDSATIEYEPADSSERVIPFHVHRISHQAVRASDTPAGQPEDPAASCNQDVNCYGDWASTKKSVGHIQFEETEGK